MSISHSGIRPKRRIDGKTFWAILIILAIVPILAVARYSIAGETVAEQEKPPSYAATCPVPVRVVQNEQPRAEWLPVQKYGPMRITVYGPARNGIDCWPITSYVSRWFGRTRADTGFTVGDALEWAEELGLDGICAASPGPSNLYSRHRDPMPPIIEVEGHGRYLVVDRTATWLWNVIDIWVPDPWPGGTYFAENCEVKEIKRNE